METNLGDGLPYDPEAFCSFANKKSTVFKNQLSLMYFSAYITKIKVTKFI